MAVSYKHKMYMKSAPGIKVEGQLVVRVPVAAQQLHLLLDPLHVGRRPAAKVIKLFLRYSHEEAK